MKAQKVLVTYPFDSNFGSINITVQSDIYPPGEAMPIWFGFDYSSNIKNNDDLKKFLADNFPGAIINYGQEKCESCLRPPGKVIPKETI